MSDDSNFPGFGYDPFKPDTLIRGDIDPFIGRTQTQRMRAYCRVTVDGLDVTEKLNPHLISITVKVGDPSDEAELELDDRDGVLPIPPVPSLLTVELGWSTEQMTGVFAGIIVDVEHGFGRKAGGRRMWIKADGADLFGKVKEPVQDHMGEGAPPGKQEGNLFGLPGWMQQFLDHAGVKANISGQLSQFKQDYWSAGGESPMHLVNSLSQQFGLMHRFHSGNAVDIMVPGEMGISCYARWNDNLISWRVKPISGRSSFGGSKQQHYDTQSANWKLLQQSFDLPGIFGKATADLQSQMPAGTESAAGQDNQGAQSAAESSNQGNGRIIINGEPGAKWDSRVILEGARPGVDGEYLINQVIHVYSRQGFTTTLNVEPWATASYGQSINRGFLPRPALNTG